MGDNKTCSSKGQADIGVTTLTRTMPMLDRLELTETKSIRNPVKAQEMRERKGDAMPRLNRSESAKTESMRKPMKAQEMREMKGNERQER